MQSVGVGDEFEDSREEFPHCEEFRDIDTFSAGTMW